MKKKHKEREERERERERERINTIFQGIAYSSDICLEVMAWKNYAKTIPFCSPFLPMSATWDISLLHTTYLTFDTRTVLNALLVCVHMYVCVCVCVCERERERKREREREREFVIIHSNKNFS